MRRILSLTSPRLRRSERYGIVRNNSSEGETERSEGNEQDGRSDAVHAIDDTQDESHRKKDGVDSGLCEDHIDVDMEDEKKGVKGVKGIKGIKGIQEESEENKEKEEIKEKGQLDIRILDLQGKTYEIKTKESVRIDQLKETIAAMSSTKEELQRLIYKGKILETGKTLQDYAVESGHTIHLFRRNPPSTGTGAITMDMEADEGNHRGIAIGINTSVRNAGNNNNNETSPHVSFTGDDAGVDPLMFDTPLGNSARRVKLWSSFFVIIYTMKVLSQFALLANVQSRNAMNHNTDISSDAQNDSDSFRNHYALYRVKDPLTNIIEMLIHCFGVYVGCIGFRAVHRTDIQPIWHYCKALVVLAVLTLGEQMCMVIQLTNMDEYQSQSLPMDDGYQNSNGDLSPTINDIITANILQGIILIIMWCMAIRHALQLRIELLRYNESLPIAIVNPVLPTFQPTSTATAIATATAEEMTNDTDLENRQV